MEDRLIRVKEVCALTSLSRSKIYSLVAEGAFPKQQRKSHRVAVWRLSDVKRWMGTQDDEILV